MDLYIQLRDNEPFEHPIPDWNMEMFFPDLDPENPPEGFGRFHREPFPELKENEIMYKVVYELSNYYTDLYKTKTWTDVYHVREKTAEELLAEGKPVEEVPQPDYGTEFFWSAEKNKWVSSLVFENVFKSFYEENNLKFEDVNLETLEGLTEEQKVKFKELIAEYNRITDNKW